MKAKQIIVVRHDLIKGPNKVRIGKMMAQVAHASLGSLLKWFKKDGNIHSTDSDFTYSCSFTSGSILDDWLNGKYTKIVVSVPIEEDLIKLEQECKFNGIPCCLITDAGITEFHGISTITCLGIGPYIEEDIDKLTKDLPLL